MVSTAWCKLPDLHAWCKLRPIATPRLKKRSCRRDYLLARKGARSQMMMGQDYFLARKGTRNQQEGRAYFLARKGTRNQMVMGRDYLLAWEPNHDTKLPFLSEKYEEPNDDGTRLPSSSERYEEPNDNGTKLLFHLENMRNQMTIASEICL